MGYKDRHIESIRSLVPGAKISVVHPAGPGLEKYLIDAEILVFSPLNHAKLVDFARMPKLKWAHITSAGVGDIAERLKNSSVLLTNSSGVHPISITEHVFGLMLMLSRRLHVAHETQVKEGRWKQEDIATELVELHGSTIGIVGFGKIGQQVAHTAKGFGMQVHALIHTTPSSNPNVDVFYDHSTLPELLRSSDFVVNCLPLTSKTKNFFNEDSFEFMKSSAYFINIGRGQTVQESALVKAIESRRIKGAGLDVFDEEPLPETSPLWQLENTILTPHIAGWSPKYIDRVIHIFTANLTAYQNNRPMPTLVDKDKNY
jgi:D-2-hydroxyacid dehydrogenase (NADP+)